MAQERVVIPVILDDEEALQDAQRLQRELDQIDGSRQVEIQAETRDARRQVDQLERNLDEVDRDREVEVRVETEQSRRRLNGLIEVFNNVGEAVNDTVSRIPFIGDAVSALGTPLGRVTGLFTGILALVNSTIQRTRRLNEVLGATSLSPELADVVRRVQEREGIEGLAQGLGQLEVVVGEVAREEEERLSLPPGERGDPSDRARFLIEDLGLDPQRLRELPLDQQYLAIFSRLEGLPDQQQRRFVADEFGLDESVIARLRPEAETGVPTISTLLSAGFLDPRPREDIIRENQVAREAQAGRATLGEFSADVGGDLIRTFTNEEAFVDTVLRGIAGSVENADDLRQFGRDLIPNNPFTGEPVSLNVDVRIGERELEDVQAEAQFGNEQRGRNQDVVQQRRGR